MEPAESPVHPIVPTLDEWERLSRAQQDAFIEQVNASHSDPLEAMSEGRPHKRATSKALDALTLHFSKIGRPIYIADELAVLYPGQESFVPDLLAVVAVEQPADDERQAWVVAWEKRGIDLVIEVLHSGSRQKDLVRNVERYARLGIPEYFVYDRKYQRLHAWRLPASGLGAYREIRPRLGRYASSILGLELAVVENRLRFYAGHAELIDSEELIDRLSRMMDDVETRADEAEAARTEAEAARTEAESRAGSAVAALRGAILAILAARGLAPSETARAAAAACDDVDRLARAAARAPSVASADDVLADACPPDTGFGGVEEPDPRK